MEFRFVTTSVLWLCLPLIAHASIRPVASIAAGADIITLHTNQNISLIEPFQNSYIGNNRKVDFVGGFFLGVEQSLCHNMLGQLGVSYYQNAVYQAQGLVYQFADPDMANLNYQYNIRSQRVMLESKLLATVQGKYHPFINIGIGEAINTASQYEEIPVTSADVPMTPGFNDKTTNAFAYLVGVGVEVDITDHMRLGGMYRYVNLGRAQLSTAPMQESNVVLKNNPFYVNEFLLQLTYLG